MIYIYFLASAFASPDLPESDRGIPLEDSSVQAETAVSPSKTLFLETLQKQPEAISAGIVSPTVADESTTTGSLLPAGIASLMQKIYPIPFEQALYNTLSTEDKERFSLLLSEKEAEKQEALFALGQYTMDVLQDSKKARRIYKGLMKKLGGNHQKRHRIALLYLKMSEIKSIQNKKKEKVRRKAIQILKEAGLYHINDAIKDLLKMQWALKPDDSAAVKKDLNEALNILQKKVPNNYEEAKTDVEKEKLKAEEKRKNDISILSTQPIFPFQKNNLEQTEEPLPEKASATTLSSIETILMPQEQDVLASATSIQKPAEQTALALAPIPETRAQELLDNLLQQQNLPLKEEEEETSKTDLQNISPIAQDLSDQNVPTPLEKTPPSEDINALYPSVLTEKELSLISGTGKQETNQASDALRENKEIAENQERDLIDLLDQDSLKAYLATQPFSYEMTSENKIDAEQSSNAAPAILSEASPIDQITDSDISTAIKANEDLSIEALKALLDDPLLSEENKNHIQEILEKKQLAEKQPIDITPSILSKIIKEKDLTETLSDLFIATDQNDFSEEQRNFLSSGKKRRTLLEKVIQDPKTIQALQKALQAPSTDFPKKAEYNLHHPLFLTHFFKHLLTEDYQKELITSFLDSSNSSKKRKSRQVTSRQTKKKGSRSRSQSRKSRSKKASNRKKYSSLRKNKKSSQRLKRKKSLSFKKTKRSRKTLSAKQRSKKASLSKKNRMHKKKSVQNKKRILLGESLQRDRRPQYKENNKKNAVDPRDVKKSQAIVSESKKGDASNTQPLYGVPLKTALLQNPFFLRSPIARSILSHQYKINFLYKIWMRQQLKNIFQKNDLQE